MHTNSWAQTTVTESESLLFCFVLNSLGEFQWAGRLKHSSGLLMVKLKSGFYVNVSIFLKLYCMVHVN